MTQQTLENNRTLGVVGVINNPFDPDVIKDFDNSELSQALIFNTGLTSVAMYTTILAGKRYFFKDADSLKRFCELAEGDVYGD